jgi:DNA adenine methylase
MQYMGSKKKIAKHILPIMLAERQPDQWWVEPFVGGANIIDKVSGNRLGNDSHPYLIALLRSLQNGWIPPTKISKQLYYAIKQAPQNYESQLVGFVGFLCSFGGKWWGGYASNRKNDNYAKRGSRVLVKQALNFGGIKFLCGDYLSLDVPDKSLIYCDPPYESTTKYKDALDHEQFWKWCRDMSLKGHTVFISEYRAPDDFECIKEISHNTILDKNVQYQRIERLFRWSRQ